MNKKMSLITQIGAAAFALAVSATAFAAVPKGAMAGYAWSGDMTGKAAPAAAYSFNSAGKSNTVKKTGTGVYEVKFEGLGTSGGHALVSAYGAGSDYCKPVRWNQAEGHQLVTVACFNKAGAPADAQFTVAFFM
jgi:hypothetical protein